MFPLVLATVVAAQLQGSLRTAGAVSGFVQSLQSDHPAAAGGAYASGTVRARVNETLERFQCAFVDDYHASVVAEGDDTATVVIDVDGFGITARQRRLPLPRRWFLQLRLRDGSWWIDDAKTEEQSVAAQLLAASGDAAREAIVEAHDDCDRVAIGLALADATLDVSRHAGGPTRDEQLDRARDAVAFAYRLVIPAGDSSDMIRALYAVTLYYGGGPAFDEQLLALAQASGDCDDLARVLLVIGNGRAWGGDASDEGAMLLQTAALVDDVDDPRLPLKALHNYSVFHQNRGGISRAIDSALKLADRAARYGWSEGEADAKMDLAADYTAMQRDDLALAWLSRAVELLRDKGNDAWLVAVLFDLAKTEVRVGDMKRAAGHYQEAMALSRTTPAQDLFRSIAKYVQALVDAGHADEASRTLEDLFRVRPFEPGSSLAIPFAAVRLAQHRDREAIDIASTVLKNAQNPYFGEMEGRAYSIIGRARARLGQRAAAVAALRQAIDIVEKRRAQIPADELARQRYFTARLDSYYALIDVLIAGGRTRQALVVAEEAKARTLLDDMTFGRAGLARQLAPADAAHEASLLAEIDRWRDAPTRGAAERLRRARLALDELRTQLRWRYPAAAIQAGDIDPLRALSTLPRGAAVVEFVVEPECTRIFVVRDGRVHVARAALRPETIRRIASNFLRAVGSRRLDYLAFATPAARQLLLPIERWIKGASALYIVPDGPLWQVPFQLLPDDSGAPLLARYPIEYVPSIALVARSHPRPSRNLLAFGDPTAAGALPDAAREVEAIAPLYGRAAEVYVGDAATRQRFMQRAPESAIIHIAAHAAVDADWPLESALLLSDRGLTAEEILGSRLRCQIAVLSACSTAGGMVRQGEGVVGLSWAFLAAGCGSTVVAQWPIGSAATMRLMVAFHRGMVAGLPPAAALRRAELAARRSAPAAHPFYWAPFVVISSGW